MSHINAGSAFSWLFLKHTDIEFRAAHLTQPSEA